MHQTGKIRRSQSPAAAPILFVPEAHGTGLRLCIDYRGINKITIANRYPLPMMSELHDHIRVTKIFTETELKKGYHLIRIKKDDKWKTAFRYRYRLYKFLVMPFGLPNAAAFFSEMMNHIVKDLFDKGIIVYIDDILFYAKTEEIYAELLKEVLDSLAHYDVVIAPEKYISGEKEVDCLAYILTPQRMRMAEDKTKAIQE
jgi:hypothetical protein